MTTDSTTALTAALPAALTADMTPNLPVDPTATASAQPSPRAADVPPGGPQGIASSHFIWALGSLCAFHRQPFAAELVLREYPPGDDARHGAADLIRAARGLGLRIAPTEIGSVQTPTAGTSATAFTKPTQPVPPVTAAQLTKLHKDLSKITMPLLVQLRSPSGISLGLVTSMGASTTGKASPSAQATAQATAKATAKATPNSHTTRATQDTQVVLFRAGSTQPDVIGLDVFAEAFAGLAWLTALATEISTDPDAPQGSANAREFNFKWFVPELLKYRSVWRDVLLASLALQLIALATPLFTQAIIDKVVVHRTQSTLIAIGIAMGIFMFFTALLSWVRQYLVLHTGNRVDAVLGQAVWEHLLKLPVHYFTHRPTGVVAARLHGVETIREFVSGAAVSLVLDLPFLFICLGVMIWYSVLLSSIAVGILLLIAIASLIMAPVFQRQLNDQFLLGARNQAFVTEHIGGFETVKTLQMEPQLKSRYASYLATYLQAGFKTKQVANTYNTFATTAEQAMTLLILIVGAYTVMTEPSFTVGMLIAFQMFASKLSQPVMRIVGLWSQFQQASLSVERLGDVMNAPIEPYSLTPSRAAQSHGALKIEALAFRYAQDRPLLYENLNLAVAPGKLIAIMGPSGTGKSTLAKLMLGFYQPTQGSISIDGIDIRNLSANELRSYFGVVPQETTLFSGSILANLRAGNPQATLDQVMQACRMAGIHDTLQALPQGYQTEIGERGAGLSGGQKQRLAIARALLKGPKILIFDEATSALDAETAESFAATINQLKGKVTMLFITHAMPKALTVDATLRIGKRGGGGGGGGDGGGATDSGAQTSSAHEFEVNANAAKPPTNARN